ncbi:MAG: type II toxin-antitoxin system MqsA family antitoxin [Pseudooceanicola sp.]
MAYSESLSGSPAGAQRFAPEDPRCDACAAGLLRRRCVDMAFWSGGRLVMVRDVPALVCDRCGEQYTQDEVAMRLDMMRGADFRHAQKIGQEEVPVYGYPGECDGQG